MPEYREYHAIITVWSSAPESAFAAIERNSPVECKITMLPSTESIKTVPADLMRATHPGETREGGPAYGDHDYERHPRLEPELGCTCGRSGAMDGHAYTCNLRRAV